MRNRKGGVTDDFFFYFQPEQWPLRLESRQEEQRGRFRACLKAHSSQHAYETPKKGCGDPVTYIRLSSPLNTYNYRFHCL